MTHILSPPEKMLNGLIFTILHATEPKFLSHYVLAANNVSKIWKLYCTYIYYLPNTPQRLTCLKGILIQVLSPSNPYTKSAHHAFIVPRLTK